MSVGLTGRQFGQLTIQAGASPSTDGRRRWLALCSCGRTTTTQGYEPGNVVSCCDVCNYAKRELTFSEFTAWVTRVYQHLVAV